MKKFVTALALAGSMAAVTLCATSSPASAAATSAASVPAVATGSPNCWGGTDGGRRGQVWCNGPAGHVRLVTECSWALWADSGDMWKPEGSWDYYNTCLYGAIKVHIYVNDIEI
ncbi:hypothetical protein [Microtetraspora malaysiensis]|uniref:hypothetical protein n=1 Tax=Microtetraspora malaysiensis TaxID=161358 RepID=UPI003D8C8358